MMELIGLGFTSGSVGSRAAAQRNLASRAMEARAAEELKPIAASPEGKMASAALSRPAYLNSPSLDMSSRRCICFTKAGVLTLSSVSSPSKPLDLVANTRSCIAAYCSNWIQIGQAEPIGIGVAALAFSARQAAITSFQVTGGFSGSSPAFSKASLLYHITEVEELKGSEASRPSGRL